jgi:hypothetical protein
VATVPILSALPKAAAIIAIRLAPRNALIRFLNGFISFMIHSFLNVDEKYFSGAPKRNI